MMKTAVCYANHFKFKDPGSAITHLIGMIMAIFAAAPLMIKASLAPDRLHVISLSIYIVSMILLMGPQLNHTLVVMRLHNVSHL